MNVTYDMIHAEQRKAALIPAIRVFLDKRLAAAPDEATKQKAEKMIAEFMAKAEAQEPAFFADCKDIAAAMKKMQGL